MNKKNVEYRIVDLWSKCRFPFLFFSKTFVPLSSPLHGSSSPVLCDVPSSDGRSCCAVGELFQLIDTADIGFLNDLGRTLGLKTEKVEELQRNVRMVAREDNRKRIWGSPDYPADRLIYPCESGAPDLLQQHIGKICQDWLINSLCSR